MKKIFVFALLLMSLASCKKSEAILEVVNESDCIYAVYEGLDPNSGATFLGNVGSNQTAEFTFEMENEVVNKPFACSAEPKNCDNVTTIQTFSFLLINNEKNTIVIK